MAEILKDIDFPWPIARIVLEHHERMNGSGYPQGLTGDNILLESRIDVVESMGSNRPYRLSLGIEAALEEIERNKGTLYDNTIADACMRLFREKGFQLETACIQVVILTSIRYHTSLSRHRGCTLLDESLHPGSYSHSAKISRTQTPKMQFCTQDSQGM